MQLALVDLSHLREVTLGSAVAQLDEALAAGKISVAVWAELIDALTDPSRPASNDAF